MTGNHAGWLCGDGVPGALLEDCARHWNFAVHTADGGLSLAAQDVEGTCAPAVLIVGRLDQDRLGRACELPFAASVEADLLPLAGDTLTRCLDPSSRTCVLTTATAYGLNVSSAVVKGLGAAGPARIRWIKTALTEAVGNAVIHGNLGLRSAEQADNDSFIAFGAKVAGMLNEETYRLRPIEVSLARCGGEVEVAVRDVGEGFDFSAGWGVADNKMSGRGLGFIEDHCLSVTHVDGGRGIVMRFLL